MAVCQSLVARSTLGLGLPSASTRRPVIVAPGLDLDGVRLGFVASRNERADKFLGLRGGK